jgi:hypothetical protein
VGRDPDAIRRLTVLAAPLFNGHAHTPMGTKWVPKRQKGYRFAGNSRESGRSESVRNDRNDGRFCELALVYGSRREPER